MDFVGAIKNKTAKLSNEQAAYFIALVSFPFSIFLKDIFTFPSYWVTCICLIYGYTIWFLELGVSINKTPYAKLLMALTFLGISTFNLALASTTVNLILEVPSSPFSYTITIVSILTTPFTMALVFAMISMPIMVLFLLNETIPIKELTAKKIITLEVFRLNKDTSVLIVIGRISACVIVLFTCISFLGDNDWYADHVSDFTKWFAYNFEMEKFSYCITSENSHVSYLDSGDIIVGLKDKSEYTFKVSICEKSYKAAI